MFRSIRFPSSCLAVAVASAAAAPSARAEALDEFTRSVDRAAVERAVLARHPSLAEGTHRERALEADARAEGSLPPPEAMVDLWQVPLERPYAVPDAGMLMVSLRQEIPGSLGAGEEAGRLEARAAGQDRARMERELVREVALAFADYTETTARTALDREVIALLEDVSGWATRRYAAGGTLAAVALADLERARALGSLRADEGELSLAAARLNALIGRPPGAPLGPPRVEEPETVAPSLEGLAARARRGNPDATAAASAQAAAEGRARAAEARSQTPSFVVGLSYFHPVSDMPAGWGATVGMSLPWLWGEGGARADGAREMARAEISRTSSVRQRIDGDVAQAFLGAKATGDRLVLLRGDATRAADRALEAARASYASPTGPDIGDLLDAARFAYDVKFEAVAARAALDRALADLDRAVGARVPRVPLVDTRAPAAGARP